MNENLPTNVQLDTNQNGSVSFTTEVIATMAGIAATEVEGVASMYSGSAGLADILTRRNQAGKGLTKGVRVEMQDGHVTVQVTIIIDYGSPVPEVAANIQDNVKKNIETMTGLTVESVDVHVQGLSFERENRTAQEIEMQQRKLLQKQEEPAPKPQEEAAGTVEAEGFAAAGAQSEAEDESDAEDEGKE